ncbi:primase-helicase family protein [Ponticaulis profundi]|uniref:Primase-helicase family protein n=1 Tax=Ponticaulis profundi TaxID=2665222 RepID=A0ABW1SEB9_9PROT
MEIMTLSAFHDYLSQFSYEYEKDGTRKTNFISKYFVNSRHCERYDGIEFEPDESKANSNMLNEWTGYSVESVEGEWGLFKSHILDNICSGNDEHFAWLMDWMAQLVQEPGRKSGSAVALIGGKGTGKSKFVDWLTRLVDPYSVTINQTKHLVGSFNHHMSGKLLMAVEEGFWAGDKQAASALKHLITSDTQMIEQKGKDAVEMSNYTRLIFTSNEKWVAPVDSDGDSRRYFILKVAEHRKNDASYFAAIDEQMERGGLEAMMFELANRAPSSPRWSNLRLPPKTHALAQQRLETLTPAQNALINALELGRIEGRDSDMNYFLYHLSENEETTVARSHMAAAFQRNQDLRGGKGRDFWDGMKMILGEDCLASSSIIRFHSASLVDEEDEPDDEMKTTRCVIPPLSQLRTVLKTEFGYDLQ